MSDHLIVIPVFDEAATVEAVVSRARRHGDVLVVDDGSVDHTAERAAAAGADVVRLDGRQGKGAALRRGFSEALAGGAERVVTLDGDGQHDPDEIPRLLAASTADPDACFEVALRPFLSGRQERTDVIPTQSRSDFAPPP